MNPIYNTIYLQLYMELIITFIFQMNANHTLTNIFVPKLYYILAISPMIPKYCLKIYYFFFKTILKFITVVLSIFVGINFR